MAKDTINALELLAEQHIEVDQLISQIEDTNDRDTKTELFRQLADKVAAHATIEEKLFYPSVMAKQTHELLLESVEEHLALKRVLADMLELDVEDEHFDAKLTVMKELFRHHAHDEEEGELFPKVRKLLSSDELAGLGNELLAMFELLLERGQPRMTIPAETAEAAPLPM
jgi:hemerythrin superfamily protein